MAEQSPTVESLLEPKEPRWVITILALVAIALLPWVLWLTVTLPSRHVSEHWDAAWVGFDVAEILAFALTAYAAWRRAPWLQGAASAAGTLLLSDAWFDILLSTGDEKVWLAVGQDRLGHGTLLGTLAAAPGPHAVARAESRSRLRVTSRGGRPARAPA